LGFVDEDLDRPLKTFSGGQLTRASLARALATGADVLLLDEPTNHLDIESLEWLEQTLVELDAALMVVAHDRWFLEAVGTAVLELEAGRSRFFAGSWHLWRREQAAREIALGRAIAAQQAEIARMERFIERFRYKATKARQAQSRIKKLAKMERLDASATGASQKELRFTFSAPARSARVIFELDDALIEVGGRIGGTAIDSDAARGREGKPDGEGRPGGERHPGEPPVTLLEHANLWLERGEHVCLVGPNGTGKTTLIETLAGRRKLAAGKLSVGHNVSIGYLSQHADELGAGGPPGQSALAVAQRATGLTPNKARALLGRFLFAGEEAEKPLSGLSGGERRRLAMAILVSSGANVLVLDEPTNHLDIESREALEDALRSFAGAILLVSHDRALLDAVGTRTIAIQQGSLQSYVGGWPEYVRVRDEQRAGNGAHLTALSGVSARPGQTVAAREPVKPKAGFEAQGSKPAGSKPKAASGAKAKSPSKNRLREQAKAEREVETAESAMKALEDELADPAAWASKYEAAKSEARHTAARRAIEDAYARLEALLD
jgi:ATP-binding cassette subfamily F protein 3